MPTAAKRARALSDDQLLDLLRLLPASDSAELKVTVAEPGHRSTAIALGMEPLKAQVELVTFFDTPDLRLHAAGVVVCARRVQRRGNDSVVKLRPVDPGDLPAHLRSSPGLAYEVEAMPGGYVCSASMQASDGVKGVRRVAAGERPVRKLFSKEQRAFFAAHAPARVDLDDLRVLGPVFVLGLRFRPQGLDGRRLVADLWLYPNGSRHLELSTKCPPDDALRAALEVRAFLSERGVDVRADKQTKTRAALASFAKHLEREAPARAPAASRRRVS